MYQKRIKNVMRAPISVRALWVLYEFYMSKALMCDLTWGFQYDHFGLISQIGHSENTWNNVDTFYEILVQVPVQNGDTRSVKQGMISTVKCDISTSVLVQTLGQNPDTCCVHSGYFSICFCLRSNLVEHPGGRHSLRSCGPLGPIINMDWFLK